MSKFIRCDYCNKVNNINEKTLNNPIITGYSCIHCSSKLDTKKLQEYKLNNNHKFNSERKNNNVIINTIKFIIIITIIIYFTIKFYDDKNDYTSEKSHYTVVKNPQSGIHLDFINKNKIAPFTIITNGNSNYYLKLRSITDKQKYITIFINKGDSVSTKIPLGLYTLTYTNGQEWYGIQNLFGKKVIHQTDKALSFTQNKKSINGHTITLYNVVNGNLHETTISKDNF